MENLPAASSHCYCGVHQKPCRHQERKMKAPKEVKRWISRQRRLDGKKNGVVPFLWENIWMGLKLVTSKKNHRRENRIETD
jgi:hypothetical protein